MAYDNFTELKSNIEEGIKVCTSLLRHFMTNLVMKHFLCVKEVHCLKKGCKASHQFYIDFLNWVVRNFNLLHRWSVVMMNLKLPPYGTAAGHTHLHPWIEFIV